MTKAAIKNEIVADGMLDVQPQLDALKIQVIKGKKEDVAVASFRLPVGTAVGRYPTVLIKSASMGATGKKGENRRGLNVVEWNLGNGQHGMFSDLKLGLKRSEQEDLGAMCVGILEKFVTKFPPTTNKKVYQDMFESITNGSEVFTATKAFQELETFSELEVCEPHNWDSPSTSFGPFLFDQDEDPKPWYAGVRISEGFPAKDDKPATDYRIVFFDERGKQIATKVEEGVTVYQKGGLPLTSTKLIKSLTDSDFYRKTRWTCTAAVQVYGMDIKCGTGNDDNAVMFPVFKLRTTGSIRFQVASTDDDESGVSMDQRTSLLDSLVFSGVAAPSKKRRRPAASSAATAKPAKKIAAVMPSSDTEVLSEEELDGEIREM